MPGTSQDSEVDALRKVAIDDCERLIAAQSALSVQLAHHVETTQGIVDTMAAGGSLRDTLHAYRSDEVRPAMSTAVRDFERARHRARIRLIAVAHAEGASDADICALWNISIELVRRAKRELAALDAPLTETEVTEP